MPRIKTCASTSNLSVGFDCLGLAFNIYNYFDVELSDKDILLYIDERFNNPDNLFLKAYHKGCEFKGIDDHVKASFETNVPVSRGLGSSSTLIVGGLKAASVLHDDILSDDEIFELAASMEGHPDNAAPCVYGGFNGSFINEEGKFIRVPLEFSDNLILNVFIPDFEVSTEKARAILPDTYSRKTAVNNSAKAVLLTKALSTGDMKLIRECAKDEIHEPYRRKLIDEFNELKDIFTEYTDGVLLISGSGSTCLGISDKPLPEEAILKIQKLKHNWEIKEVKVAYEGVEVL